MKIPLAAALAVGMFDPANAGIVARSVAGLPEIDPPPQGFARWIAPSMRLNGLPMTLKEFESRLAPDDVLAHYERWARGVARAETRRTSHGAWRVLAIRTPEAYVTVQARATIGGSEGTLSVSAPPEHARLVLESRFPRPQGVSIVSLQEYEDAGVQSEHIAMTSARSPVAEAHAFGSALVREGWTITREHASARGRARVLEAQKGAQHAFLTILPDRAQPSRTAILVVWRKE